MAKLFPYQLMDKEEALLAETKGLFKTFTWFFPEGGYGHLQATKPDTLGWL